MDGNVIDVEHPHFTLGRDVGLAGAFDGRDVNRLAGQEGEILSGRNGGKGE